MPFLAFMSPSTIEASETEIEKWLFIDVFKCSFCATIDTGMPSRMQSDVRQPYKGPALDPEIAADERTSRHLCRFIFLVPLP
jgi:hypothetical protein